MAGVPKNDLMFLQNEILGDIKKVENKLDKRITKLSDTIDDQKSTYEKKVNHLEMLFNILKQKTQAFKSSDMTEKQFSDKIALLNKKMEDHFSKIESRIALLQSNLQDSCYKYDKAIMNNNQIPGLIGERCPYSSMRDFFENINRKINESLRNKEQQSMDLKKYKEKMDSVINQNKTHLPMFENRITTYFDSQIKDIDNKYKGRIDIMEERLNSMRIENSKYSTDLIEKSRDINEKCDTIDVKIKNSLDQYNQEISTFRDSFKSMNAKLKNFDEKYNILQEKFNMINKINENIKQMTNNINKFDNKINDINNKIILLKKEVNDNYEECKNRSITKNDNYMEYRLQNDEMEINSVINSKQNNNIDDNTSKKINLKENNINVGQRKVNNNNKNSNYFDLVKNYQKKKEKFFDPSYEHTKINNIVFDADFFKKSNYIGNFYYNDYYNQNYRIKRPRKLFNRVKSGKTANHLSFHTNENNNDEQANNITSRNDNVNNNYNRYSIPDELEVNNNSIQNEKLKDDYDIRKDSTIYGNVYRSHNNIRKKYNLDLSDIYYQPGHKFKYLDKKINILSSVMVDSINKIIFQVNYLKKNITINNNNTNNNNTNQLNSEQKESLKKNLSDTKLLFRSPSYNAKTNFKKVHLDNKRKLSQRFKIVSKDNFEKNFNAKSIVKKS